MDLVFLKTSLFRLTTILIYRHLLFSILKKIALVAQARFHNVSLPELVVLPVPINLPASVESVPSLPAASHIVSPVFMFPEPSVPFSSKLTDAGLLLLPHLHQL